MVILNINMKDKYTVIGDLDPYGLSNLVDLNIKGLDLSFYKFQIIPKEVESTLIK